MHPHVCEGAWLTDRAMGSANRPYPASGERGHRRPALRFPRLLAEHSHATGTESSPEPGSPTPITPASLRWLATAGTGRVARRCTGLVRRSS